MALSKELYERNVEGFQIIDCVVRSAAMFYFVLMEDYTQWDSWDDSNEPPAETSLRTRVICYDRDEPESDNITLDEMVGLCNLLAGVSSVPKEQYVGVDSKGHVYVLGSGDNLMEEDVPDFRSKGISRGGIVKCQTIGGVCYIVGGGRSVGYRLGTSSWKSHSQGLPYNDASDWEVAGFRDIAGFSQDDIYCVGGKGDVWHFNGTKWQQIHFPSNLDLYTVCCAGDGYVYISGYGGTTFKGRGDKWKQIYKGQMTIPFKDMVWYENKVWCTSDYGLWVIENDTVIEADVDPEVKVCSGYLSAEAGVLLLGGYNGAAYKENGAWHVLF
jgi:hypothetical protein